MSHNGLNNGLYDGLLDGKKDGLHNGLIDGISSPSGEKITFIFDPDALDFFDKAGITIFSQKLALNRLVTDLKIKNLWSKLLAIYPMLGGTATSHKWNLKDRRDLDAAFRLSFFGTWVHSSTGAKPDGTTAYANTFLNPTTHMTSSGRGSLSFYSRTNSVNGGIEMGVFRLSPNIFCQLGIRYTGDVAQYLINATNTGTFQYSNTRGDGFIVASRTGTNNQNCYSWSTGGKLTSTSSNSNTNPNDYIFIGARNRASVGAQLFSDKECAFASIGASSLQTTDLDALESIVNRYQTALGRNVY